MNGLIEFLGRLHPFLVHFPIALVVTAAVAELLYMGKKTPWCGDAARFMVAAAAWMSIPAAVAGFATAAGATFTIDIQGAFNIHRIAGVSVPVLVVLAYALGEGARRSGQVWEQAVYRILLLAAAAGVLATGYFGGLLVHVAEINGFETNDFGLTSIRGVW